MHGTIVIMALCWSIWRRIVTGSQQEVECDYYNKLQYHYICQTEITQQEQITALHNNIVYSRF